MKMNTINTILRFGSIALVILSIVILIIFVRKVLKYKAFTISYWVIAASLLALSIVPFFFADRISQKTAIIFSQSYILLLGIVNIVIIEYILPWYEEQKFRWKFVYTLIILLLSILLLTFGMDKLIGLSIFIPELFASLIWFLLPLVILEMVVSYLRIPKQRYIQWFYPVDNPPGEPSDSELLNPIVISFVLKKRDKNDEELVFRSKAPMRMELGKLFYYFINDYNAKNPNSTIKYLDDEGQAYSWNLVKKKNSIFSARAGIDPYSSVQENKLVENDIILCFRD